LGAVWPRPQRDASLMMGAISSRSSMSPSLPLPRVMLVRISSIRFVPSRQGVHFPQDSSWQKSMKNRAISTAQESSFMTIKPPEPMMAPSSATFS